MHGVEALLIARSKSAPGDRATDALLCSPADRRSPLSTRRARESGEAGRSEQSQVSASALNCCRDISHPFLAARLARSARSRVLVDGGARRVLSWLLLAVFAPLALVRSCYVPRFRAASLAPRVWAAAHACRCGTVRCACRAATAGAACLRGARREGRWELSVSAEPHVF